MSSRRLAELQLPGLATPLEPTAAMQGQTKHGRRRGVLLASLLAACLLMVAALVFLWNRIPHEHRASPPAPAARGSAEIDPAIAELNRAIALHPDDKNARLRRSAALAKRRLYQEAIADLDLAIALDPQFFQAFIDRGWYYNSLGKKVRAIGDFSTAIGLNPKNAWARYSRGMMYNDLGDWEKAIPDLERYLTLDPKSDGALREPGQGDPCERKPGPVARYCEKAVAVNPTNLWNYLERGLTHRARKEWDLAIRDFQAVDRLWSLNNLPGLASMGMNNLGGLYRDKGDLRRAIESYDEAIRRDGKSAGSHAERAKTYLLLKDWDHAIPDFDRAIELDPASAGRYADRAWARRTRQARPRDRRLHQGDYRGPGQRLELRRADRPLGSQGMGPGNQRFEYRRPPLGHEYT